VVGATDTELQDAVIEELKKVKADWRKPGSTEWIDWKYYTQMKPQKQDAILVDEDGNYVLDENGYPIMIPPETRDEDQEDYMVVMIDDEDENQDGEWVVQVIIAVSIYAEDDKNQGLRVIQDVLNRIWMHFAKQGIIAGKYEMEHGAKKRFNLENDTNFYEGVLITKWKLPRVFPESVSELV
ncbi:MAG: hypothetical protein J5966_07640, partial [Lachnospiraceae bacterium]|nr:hypothetical protein [Lachnospiraceae bacterium]